MTNEGQNDSEEIQEVALRIPEYQNTRIPEFKRMKIWLARMNKSYRYRLYLTVL